jgi:D-alanyl-D-alanine carboxypeptidase
MLFSNRFDEMCRAAPIIGRRLESMLLLLSILLLAACGQQGGSGYVEYGAPPPSAPMHYYPPPGPPGDPWGPYISEASTRYGVPGQWIRAVMRQESGGQEQAVSPVGAMGLMQVMPETYEGLRERYGLGDDPYDPHNNILAGTAYIREMYDRFGAPGFLAAYNAGPDRVDAYLAGGSGLPDETVNYLASVTPNLGNAVPLSGPLATYASAHRGRTIAAVPDAASLAAGCDLSRAYDPNHPCTSLMRVASTPAPAQPAFVPQTGIGGCDLSAAYDPNHPCSSVGQAAAPVQLAFAAQIGAGGCDLSAAYDPSHPCTSIGQSTSASVSPAVQPQQDVVRQAAIDACDPNIAYDPDRPCQGASAASTAVSPPMEAQRASAVTALASYQPATPVPSAEPGNASPHLLAIPDRGWAIQVGAFKNPGLARAVAEGARAEAPDQLRTAALALPPTPYGGSVLYRARLVHLSASAASDACWQLNQRQLPCVVVQPNRS